MANLENSTAAPNAQEALQAAAHSAAERLVADGASFLQDGSISSSDRFAEEWQSIVGAGRQFRGMVVSEAEKITQDPANGSNIRAHRGSTWTTREGWEDSLSFDLTGSAQGVPKHIEGVADGVVYSCIDGITPNNVNNKCIQTRPPERHSDISPELAAQANVDAEKLLQLGKQFVHGGALETSQEFSRVWQGVVQRGVAYEDLVKKDAETLADKESSAYDFSQTRDLNDKGEFGMGQVTVPYFGGFLAFGSKGKDWFHKPALSLLASDDGTVTIGRNNVFSQVATGDEALKYRTGGGEAQDDAMLLERAVHAYETFRTPATKQIIQDLSRKFERSDSAYKEAMRKPFEAARQQLKTDGDWLP